MPRRGWTDKPCEGCGKTGGRPTGENCLECQHLLTFAREVIAEREQKQESGVYLAPWRFNYHTGDGPAYRGRIAKAMLLLLKALSEPMETFTAGDIPTLLEPLPHWQDNHERRSERIRIRHDYAAILRELDSTILAQLDSAYTQGYERGRNLLTSLAKGELSVDDFNKATIAADRRREEAARKGQ